MDSELSPLLNSLCITHWENYRSQTLPTDSTDEPFFKKRPTERCEMFETRPRRIASSAISRWLQWLIGRSLSDGFSQVIAITAQICSGVYVAGAPERGASASRSDTDWAAGACR